MNNTHIISPQFLQRLEFTQEQLLSNIKAIAKQFKLGSILYIKGIEEGYEDINIELKTTKGHYLVKILVDYLEKKPRSREDAEYYVYVMSQLLEGGIRVPKLYMSSDNKHLFEISNQPKAPIFAIVMEYFEGKHFLQIKPTLKDMESIVLILSKFHSLDLRLGDKVYDDPWQPQSLAKYYSINKKLFKQKDKHRLESIIRNLDRINLDHYKKTPTHGDIMRNNIMKSKEGEYCLLDFGVVAMNHWIIDLALYLAGFCLDPSDSVSENKDIFKKVTSAYVARSKLRNDFRDDLYILIQASYGAFYLASMLDKKLGGNESKENSYWIDLGNRGMDMIDEMTK